jgi:hypothetical protein
MTATVATKDDAARFTAFVSMKEKLMGRSHDPYFSLQCFHLHGDINKKNFIEPRP